MHTAEEAERYKTEAKAALALEASGTQLRQLESLSCQARVSQVHKVVHRPTLTRTDPHRPAYIDAPTPSD